jgi:membrane fusion protein, multidrug efflux system
MKYKECFFILTTILLFVGCQSKNNQYKAENLAISVLTTQSKMVSSNNEISLSGNIEGNKTVRLGFMGAGKINLISACEGQMVTKGQLLSSLDPASYSIAKEIADIQVSQVEDEFNRMNEMHDRKSISESDFAKVSFGLQQAKAQQKLQAKNLADTKLYSPISGVLLKKMAEVGEITGVGISLFVVSDIRTVKVTAFIPENELHLIKIGQKATVQVSSLENTFEGKVIEVGSAADMASRAFMVRIELDNPKLQIRPGMIAEVKISSEQKNEVLVLPVGTILNDLNDRSFVYVVDSVSKKAFKRDVNIGKLINEQIEITSGLRENEMVVCGGQHNLVDGSSITISK